MSPRWGLVGVLGALAAVGVWLGAVGIAFGNTLTPVCTVAGQTTNCDESGSWFQSEVSLTWQVDPTPTKAEDCGPKPFRANLYDDVTTVVSCSVWWGLNGTLPMQSISFPLNVEASTPTAGAFPSRPADSNGWYNHPLTVGFAGLFSFSGWGRGACSSSTTYAGPDTLNTTIAGSCTDIAGKTATASTPLHYDATPPLVTNATPLRPPNRNGWYNRPVSFSFGGSDATSGLAGCSAPTYAGPNNASASVSGTCTDKAGNAAGTSVPLHYDSSPPAVSIGAETGDGVVSLRWFTGGDVAPIQSVTIARSPGLDGSRSVLYRGHGHFLRDDRVSNGRRYTYTITAVDDAGNVTVRTIRATPGLHILSPALDARVSTPPLLSWTPKRHADYYNVQLYRGKRKILSIWPQSARLQLGRAWKFERHRYRLRPGGYRWYVWPGFGPRSAGHYGRLIGTGTFIFAPST
jgi:hypothetical protein